MAMAVGGSGDMNSDINVTPFIDVLLVLLVIFMVALPGLRKVLDIQVPLEEESLATQTPSSNIVLEIAADGSLSINTQPVTRPNLDARLREIYDPRPDKLLFIKAHLRRPYSELIEVIDVARGAGVLVFGLAPPTAEERAAAAGGI